MSLAGSLLLTSCSGGGGGDGAVPEPTVSAGPDCELRYTLTQSPLLTGTDPLLGEQWHLRNTGQNGGMPGEDLRALDAWTTTRGAGVRVAVVDDAVEIVHPDLAPNAIEGASFSYRRGNRGTPWPLPCTAALDATGQPIDGHGTSVAGIVLARDDNRTGGAGVAPRASLVAYDALSSGTNGDIADALLRDTQLNQIYNNSWGSPDDGSLHVADPAFAAAIEDGIARGRGGRGTVFVFPGGNGGCFARSAGDLRCQVDNANFDGFVNRRGVIAVCAVDENGRQPWFGEPGANLLVCGPSSGRTTMNITTTGLRGGFVSDFGGTSASTPMVSGVVSLMLAVNPELTWRDVRLILAQTARRNDPDDPGWTAGPDGLAFNHKYGFGAVDARAAINRAIGWPSVGGLGTLTTCTSPVRTPALAIPDAPSAGGAPTPVSDSLALSDCPITRIEFVEIEFGATHSYSGDLRVRLTSPAGTVSELANERICLGEGSNPCGAYSGWTFGSVRHLNETAAGTWTLAVTDMTPFDSGRLDRWSLRIHGR